MRSRGIEHGEIQRIEDASVNTDPLAALKDIYLPVAPDWWPPAPGWWLLVLILMGGLYYLVRFAASYWQATRPIRAAKRIVDTLIEEERESSSDDVLLANQCNEILKRLLVVALGINHLSQASGDDWLKALDQLGECSDFSQGPGRALGEARFARDFVADRQALLGCVRRLLAKIHHSKSRQQLEARS